MALTAHVIAALVLALVAQRARCTSYGYSTPGYYYGYGSRTVLLTRPELILPPAPGLAPSDVAGQSGEQLGPSAEPAVPEAPSCSVYAKAYGTGQGTGHVSLIVSSTSNTGFEAPYTLAWANPSLSGIASYNANNAPANVALGEGGIISAEVQSTIPAQNSNTFEFDVTSASPDASYNPAGAYMPIWVSVNGVTCGIVTGF